MNFPMRNRIISGLSDAVILVEARGKKAAPLSLPTWLWSRGKRYLPSRGGSNDPIKPWLQPADPERSRPCCLGPEDVLEAFGIKFEKKRQGLIKKQKRGLQRMKIWCIVSVRFAVRIPWKRSLDCVRTYPSRNTMECLC